jgi:serine/threonine protein kinase
MDCGLAKLLASGGLEYDVKSGKRPQEMVIATVHTDTDPAGLSRFGSAMGTPAYMAPEQARGEGDRVDERADVFSLGSVLCEVLTGQPAFLGRTTGEILRKAALDDTAEPLVLSGYEGMKAREAKILLPGRPRLGEAADRVVKLYEAWGKDDQAAAWRAKLGRPSDKPKQP